MIRDIIQSELLFVEFSLNSNNIVSYKICTNLQSEVLQNLAAVSSKIETMVNQPCDTTKYQKNIGKIVVYIENFNYISIQESPAYEVRFDSKQSFIH